MLRTLEEKVDPKHAALLVIDVQNDFCHNDGLLAKSGHDLAPIQEMIPRLVHLIEAARAASTLVVFLQITHSEVTESEVQQERRLRSGPVRDHQSLICREGSWGADFYVVRPQPGEPVIKKHRFSGFLNTTLDVFLRSNGIRSLVLTGVATQTCVECTARDGFMRDYYIVLVSDCTASYDMERHQATLINIRDTFGVVTTAEEVIQAWPTVGVTPTKTPVS